ncbi:MAG: hypothetical protein K0R92_444 [Lachnospiraceae bacterium]|jgi:hypothetical protein|nr:hypothetical protein [Lachnospiraceae bacterium]
MNKEIEKAIEFIKAYSVSSGFNTEEKGYFKTAITALEAQKDDRWIPISSGRVPVGKEYEVIDADGDILHKHVACTTDDCDNPVVIGFYQDGDWFTASTYDLINVKAWRPLEPWKEEQP